MSEGSNTPLSGTVTKSRYPGPPEREGRVVFNNDITYYTRFSVKNLIDEETIDRIHSSDSNTSCEKKITLERYSDFVTTRFPDSFWWLQNSEKDERPRILSSFFDSFLSIS